MNNNEIDKETTSVITQRSSFKALSHKGIPIIIAEEFSEYYAKNPDMILRNAHALLYSYGGDGDILDGIDIILKEFKPSIIITSRRNWSVINKKQADEVRMRRITEKKPQ